MKGWARLVTTGIVVAVAALAVYAWLALLPQMSRAAEEPWPGVDVSVIEKYARDAGQPPREPLINTDQGDLLLFVFALGGAAGGFVAGYYWRQLMAERG